MDLPIEAEELLDDLRRRKLDEALTEIMMLLNMGIDGEDLRYMQILEYRILRAYHDPNGYAERQRICEEIARFHV